MDPHQFLDLLDKRGVLAPADIDSLHEQVDAVDEPMHPVFIARRLVEVGFLNPYFAKTLLADGAELYRGDETADPAERTTSETPRVAAERRPDDGLMASLDDLQLPAIGGLDLLADAQFQQAALLPTLRRRKGVAAWVKSGVRHKPLILTQPERFERRLLIACGVLAVAVLALLVYVLATW